MALARVIWQRTTVRLPWLAEHLALKSAANASQKVRRWKARPNDLQKPCKDG